MNLSFNLNQKHKMESINIFSYLFTLLLFFDIANAASTKLFREYIGAGGSGGVEFTDVPINGNVEFHFILSFAIDYTTNEKNPSPTNGKFNIFWDGKHLTPAAILSMKRQNRNVRFIVSLGGDTVANRPANFAPKSISSWVRNAAASLSAIIKKYHLDGIDIDYEHFSSNPEVFAECIGSLIIHLKSKKVISLASIAPYEDVQSHYLPLWKKFHRVIDYVNFQFYAYDKGTSVQNFLKFSDRQTSNYKGGQILASFGTDNSGGLKPEKGFFKACELLKRKGKLGGIFVWSADDSKKSGYKNEKLAQQLLALH